MARKEPEKRLETCQQRLFSGTKALTYGFHARQNRGSLVLQYETHVYLMENTGVHIAF